MYSVLLVEDDAQIREVIGDYFGRRDKITLDFAEDGNIGLSKFLNGSYDLISKFILCIKFLNFCIKNHINVIISDYDDVYLLDFNALQ